MLLIPISEIMIIHHILQLSHLSFASKDILILVIESFRIFFSEIFSLVLFLLSFSFSALTLLVGRQEGHLACRKTGYLFDVLRVKIGSGVFVCCGDDLELCTSYSSSCHHHLCCP